MQGGRRGSGGRSRAPGRARGRDRLPHRGLEPLRERVGWLVLAFLRGERAALCVGFDGLGARAAGRAIEGQGMGSGAEF